MIELVVAFFDDLVVVDPNVGDHELLVLGALAPAEIQLNRLLGFERVQIDEFPSMYSRPRLSRKIAPCPSTITIGSCSGAHHSGMLVNGCQTNCLSVVIKSFVFQLLMRLLFSRRISQGHWRVELLRFLARRVCRTGFEPARATKLHARLPCCRNQRARCPLAP